jgi:hypothetical protein
MGAGLVFLLDYGLKCVLTFFMDLHVSIFFLFFNDGHVKAHASFMIMMEKNHASKHGEFIC